MLLEIHAHTNKYSKCSRVDPVTLVKQVVRKQLQGVIITEHHYLWLDEELLKLRREAEAENSFLILSGQEVETDIGHIVVLGASKSIEQGLSLDELRSGFPEAALIWAHPFRSGKIPAAGQLTDSRLDAIEIFSSNHTPKENYLGLAAWHKYKFTAVGGTDTHAKLTAGILPTQFDHPVRTIGDVAEEVKRSRCRPFFKEVPKSGSNLVVTEITLGTKGEDELRDRIILKKFSDNDKWDKMKETLSITEKLYDKGFSDGVFRIPRLIDVNDDEKLVIEEGQRGKKLFEVLSNVNPAVGANYMAMAAKWLVKFHNVGCSSGDIGDTKRREDRRMASYLKSFKESSSPYTPLAQELVEFVSGKETDILSGNAENLVLNHGDYHPKNIIIGQDKTHDISTLFISVIDFDNAILAPRAFDVGYFLSQFASQFWSEPGVINAYKEEDFISVYASYAGIADNKAFEKDVEFYKTRANLSIASFFIKVGKGTSEEMRDVMSRSAESLKILRKRRYEKNN